MRRPAGAPAPSGRWRSARARYLRDAYRDLADWGLAIASYNDGVSGMVRARPHFGGERILLSYHGCAFGFSSRNFYAEFLAVRSILADLPRYFPEGIQFHPAWKRNVSF